MKVALNFIDYYTKYSMSRVQARNFSSHPPYYLLESVSQLFCRELFHAYTRVTRARSFLFSFYVIGKICCLYSQSIESTANNELMFFIWLVAWLWSTLYWILNQYGEKHSTKFKSLKLFYLSSEGGIQRQSFGCDDCYNYYSPLVSPPVWGFQFISYIRRAKVQKLYLMNLIPFS
jgi:hypothetical protein